MKKTKVGDLFLSLSQHPEDPGVDGISYSWLLRHIPVQASSSTSTSAPQASHGILGHLNH